MEPRNGTGTKSERERLPLPPADPGPRIRGMTHPARLLVAPLLLAACSAGGTPASDAGPLAVDAPLLPPDALPLASDAPAADAATAAWSDEEKCVEMCESYCEVRMG